MRKRPRAKRNRAATLVVGHLEHVSRKGLDRYREVVFDVLKDANGIYVLFGDRRPYFISMMDSFTERLDMHLKDWRWDTASFYLTGEECGIHDLEILLLKAAVPDGNRKEGGFIGSRDLKPEFRRRVAEQQKMELASIILDGEPPVNLSEKREKTRVASKPVSEKEKQDVKKTAEPEEKLETKSKKPKARRRPKGKKYVLAPYAKKGFEIRFWYKGRLVTAMVEKNGSIKYGEKSFSSPSLAASEVMGRTVNGWMVWKYERSPGEWVLLNELKSRT